MPSPWRVNNGQLLKSSFMCKGEKYFALYPSDVGANLFAPTIRKLVTVQAPCLTSEKYVNRQ